MKRENRKNDFNQVQVNGFEARAARRRAIQWAAAIAAGLFAGSAQASVVTWDNAGLTNNWSTAAGNEDWLPGNVVWVNGNSAIFGATPETVTTTTTNIVDDITFQGSWTIANGAAASINLTTDGNSDITVDPTFTSTIAEVVSGTNTLTKLGTGTLLLTNTNTYAGTTITAGTLGLTTNNAGFGTGSVAIGASGTANITFAGDANLANVFTGTGTITVAGSTGTPNFTNASALNGFTGTLNVNTTGGKKMAMTTAGAKIGSGATVNITSGGTLYLATSTASNDGVTFNVVGSGNTENLGAIRIEAGSVIGATSSVVLGGNTSLGSNSGTGTINAVISQSTASAVTKVGNGTLVFGNANTYGGGTTISAGTLSAGNDAAFGAGTVVFGGGNGNTVASSANVTLANNFTDAGGFGNFTASGGTMTINGNYTGSRQWNVTATNKITFAGTNTVTSGFGGQGLNIVAGAGGVDFTGTTTINGAAGASSAGYLLISGSAVSVKTGGTLNINGTTNANKASVVVGNSAATGTLSLDGGNLNIGGNLGSIVGGVAGSTGVLTINTGTATFTRGSATATDVRSFIAIGQNTATGTINLNGGTLATDRNFVRDGNSTADASGTANFVFGGGTLKALADQTDWLNTATINTNQLALSSVTTTAVSTIDANGKSVAINSAISGVGGFTINSTTGTGTVTFGGANTYGGGTTVQSGTLATSAAGKLGTGNVTIVTATLDLGNASSIADSATLFFVSTSGVVLNTGVNYEVLTSIVNTTTSKTLDASSFGITGLYVYTASDLNTFFGGSVFSGSGTVAVPEPSSLALLGLASAGLLARRRRNNA